MNIKVELENGDVVTVSRQGLDRLLERRLARRFQRGSGWVTVGINPVRSTRFGNNSYNGRERRHEGTRITH